MPLQFIEGQNAESLQLTGLESFTIDIPESLAPQQQISVHVSYPSLLHSAASHLTLHCSISPKGRWKDIQSDHSFRH